MAASKPVQKKRVCKDCPSLPPPPADRADRVPGTRYRPKKDLDAPYRGPRCYHCDLAERRRIRKANHERRVSKVYGLEAGQYDQLYAIQNGVCAICNRATGASKKLAVDHDHDTGEVRGLLCKLCNRDILGHLRDSIEALERAIAYLKDPPARKLKSVS